MHPNAQARGHKREHSHHGGQRPFRSMMSNGVHQVCTVIGVHAHVDTCNSRSSMLCISCRTRPVNSNRNICWISCCALPWISCVNSSEGEGAFGGGCPLPLSRHPSSPTAGGNVMVIIGSMVQDTKCTNTIHELSHSGLHKLLGMQHQLFVFVFHVVIDIYGRS